MDIKMIDCPETSCREGEDIRVSRDDSSTDLFGLDESDRTSDTPPKKKIMRKRRKKQIVANGENTMITDDSLMILDNFSVDGGESTPSTNADAILREAIVEMNSTNNPGLRITSVVGGYADTVSDFSQGVLAEIKSDEMSDTSKDFTSPTRISSKLPDVIQETSGRDTTGSQSATHHQTPITLTDREKMIRSKALEKFSTADILDYLVQKRSAFKCECGVIVKEREDLFCYHRACHSHVNPLKCAFCHFEAQSPFDFNSHFFRHTVQFPNKTSFQLRTSPPVLETFD